MISTTPNKDIAHSALETLKGKWQQAVIGTLIYMAILAVLNFIHVLGALADIVIAGPLLLGYITFILAISRGGLPEFGVIFSGFDNFLKAFCLYWLMAIFIFLWALLLIVPGIIAALSYALSFFILSENPNIGAMEAIDRSKALMQGNKWKLFCLLIRFIGWAILCVLTLGIGLLWLIPYVQVSVAKFYDEVKVEA